MKDREPLKVLEAAREFARQIVMVTRLLPRRAPEGLRSQLAEAAQSISGIIAEGFGRGTNAEKIHYLRMANGSLEESQNYLRQCMNTRLFSARPSTRPPPPISQTDNRPSRL